MEGEAPTTRLWLAAALAAALAASLALRWQHLQVREFSRFAELARENQIKVLPVEPLRGLIYDRNGRQLASNRTSFSLRVGSDYAADVLGKMDSLQEVIAIPPAAVERLQKAVASKVYQGEIILMDRLSEEQITRFLSWQFLFPEVVLEAQHVRHYPHQDGAGHVLGYVGRINRRDLDNLKKAGNEKAYRGAKFIGKTGVELINEKRLRGAIGFQEAFVDAHGRILESRILTPPTPGKDIYLTLDWELQQLAERLLAGERGAAVAMDTRSGALLALASNPRFDINKFVFGISQTDWDALNTSEEKPLIHRAIYGQYAPGSTIKPFLALAALARGWRDADYTYLSRGFFQLTPKHVFHDWKDGGHGRVNIADSIIRSVNTFYYELGNDIGIEEMRNGLAPFGFGKKSGIDLDNEKGGILPHAGWKRERFNEAWFPGDTVAAAVGQGYMQATPLQMARAMATIANNGRPVLPHLLAAAAPAAVASYEPEHLRIVKDALAKVTQPGGTAASVGRGADYGIAGKTGTAQVSRLRRDEEGARIKNEDLPKRLRDHAWFVGYAPANNPQVAVAVIVENGGSGGRAAGPIARQIFDQALATQAAAKEGH